MGLDIYHNKATLQRPAVIDPFNHSYVLESDFEGFDANIDYFNACIQLVDSPRTLETIIYPKTEKDISEAKELLKDGDYIFQFVKDVDKMDIALRRYVETYKLINNYVHKWEAPNWIGYHIYNYEKQRGFYYENVGFQRKGMNERFSARFASDGIVCFTGIADFEFALSCVDFYWDTDTKEDVEVRQEAFRKNFVNNYEINASWMDLDY